MASFTAPLEALERRGRALRAEIGRKVEELAHEESRVMREAAADGEDVEKVRAELGTAEKLATQSRQLADAAVRAGTIEPSIFERAGAAAATAQAKREQLGRYENKKAARESNARDLRRQTEELRGQLGRYAEALEEDLAQGREKVAMRTREGVGFGEGVHRGVEPAGAPAREAGVQGSHQRAAQREQRGQRGHVE